MNKVVRLALPVLVVCLVLVAAGGRAHAQAITPGYDLLESDSGATLDDLQLGASFFGPGSLPFEGRVYLKGVPFATFDPDGPGPAPTFTDLLPTDTVIRRTAGAGPLYPSTIPIQIVQLSLVSVNPITVSFSAGPDQSWQVGVSVRVNPATGLVDPPQGPGTMTIRHESANGGTFDSTLPVQPYLTFTRVDAPGTIGPILSPVPVILATTGESWSHVANPLIFPADGEAALVVPGLTSNFFPGCVCAACPAPTQSPLCYSVDGGAFNALRDGAPLRPAPNPAEGLLQPDPRHPVPNDVYALGTAPGGDLYATEGEVFQSAGAPLGAPPNGTNVDRMSSSLGIGPIPAPPPYLGPFSPNPGAPAPRPVPPGALGTFGLTPNDNLDALSFGRDSGHVLFFSVDPASLGIPATHVRREAVTSPFGGAAAPPFPTNPGGGDPGREAAGDIFKTFAFAPFGSYIPLHFATGRFIAPAIVAANELVYDERLLGLQAPARNGSAIAAPEDNLDGLEVSDAGDPIFGVDLVNNATGVAPPDGIPDRFVFFSIDTASPSNAIPGIDPDDILMTPPGGFVFSVFADGATTMGLLPGDDIDALALSDVPPFGVLNPGRDEALFSLHPGSPSVRFGPDALPGTGDEVSAADVFYTNFTGTHPLYAASGALGLLPTDNVDALDIWPRDLSAPGGGGGGGGAKKKLSVEDEARAKHGIRISQKRRCNMTSTTATFNVTIFNPPVGSFVLTLTGPSTGMRGATEFNPATGQTKIPIELLTMNLTGNSPLGPMTVRAGREMGFEPSLGEIDPHSTTSDFPAQSFFDVFVHIQTPSLSLHTDRPFRVQATVTDFPPYGSGFQGNDPVQLLDSGGIPVGVINSALHRPLCVVPSDCDDLNPCTIDSCNTITGTCQHAAAPDADGDGVCDPLDNCSNAANPGQGALVFPVYPEMIKFTTKTQFCWTTPAAVHVVYGPLSNVSSYAVTAQFHEPAETCHAAPELPSPSGLYYLIERDCPAASFQSSIGMEPARDDILP